MIQVIPLVTNPDKGHKNIIGNPLIKNTQRHIISKINVIQKDAQTEQLITFANLLFVSLFNQYFKYTRILRTGYWFFFSTNKIEAPKDDKAISNK